MDLYRVGIRARSAGVVAEGDVYRESRDGLVRELMIKTEFRGSDEPTALLLDVVGTAESFEDAIATFPNLLATYLPVLSVCANVAIANGEFGVAYRVGPGPGPHPFVQHARCGTRGPCRKTREFDLPLVGAVLDALGATAEHETIRRAMEHYRLALDTWEASLTIAVAEHLWLATETLGRAVRDRICRERAIDKRALQQLEGCSSLDELDGRLRRREIFDGDTSTYKALSDASQAYEHGFHDFERIRSHGGPVLHKAAMHVRRGLLVESGVRDPDLQGLLAPTFAKPLLAFDPIVTYVGEVDAKPGFDLAIPNERVELLGDLDIRFVDGSGPRLLREPSPDGPNGARWRRTEVPTLQLPST